MAGGAVCAAPRCKCAGFNPSKWQKHQCQQCFHSIKQHSGQEEANSGAVARENAVASCPPSFSSEGRSAGSHDDQTSRQYGADDGGGGGVPRSASAGDIRRRQTHMQPSRKPAQEERKRASDDTLTTAMSTQPAPAPTEQRTHTDSRTWVVRTASPSPQATRKTLTKTRPDSAVEPNTADDTATGSRAEAKRVKFEDAPTVRDVPQDTLKSESLSFPPLSPREAAEMGLTPEEMSFLAQHQSFIESKGAATQPNHTELASGNGRGRRTNAAGSAAKRTSHTPGASTRSLSGVSRSRFRRTARTRSSSHVNDETETAALVAREREMERLRRRAQRHAKRAAEQQQQVEATMDDKIRELERRWADKVRRERERHRQEADGLRKQLRGKDARVQELQAIIRLMKWQLDKVKNDHSSHAQSLRQQVEELQERLQSQADRLSFSLSSPSGQSTPSLFGKPGDSPTAMALAPVSPPYDRAATGLTALQLSNHSTAADNRDTWSDTASVFSLYSSKSAPLITLPQHVRRRPSDREIEANASPLPPVPTASAIRRSSSAQDTIGNTPPSGPHSGPSSGGAQEKLSVGRSLSGPINVDTHTASSPSPSPSQPQSQSQSRSQSQLQPQPQPRSPRLSAGTPSPREVISRAASRKGSMEGVPPRHPASPSRASPKHSPTGQKLSGSAVRVLRSRLLGTEGTSQPEDDEPLERTPMCRSTSAATLARRTDDRRHDDDRTQALSNEVMRLELLLARNRRETEKLKKQANRAQVLEAQLRQLGVTPASAETTARPAGESAVKPSRSTAPQPPTRTSRTTERPEKHDTQRQVRAAEAATALKKQSSRKPAPIQKALPRPSSTLSTPQPSAPQDSRYDTSRSVDTPPLVEVTVTPTTPVGTPSSPASAVTSTLSPQRQRSPVRPVTMSATTVAFLARTKFKTDAWTPGSGSSANQPPEDRSGGDASLAPSSPPKPSQRPKQRHTPRRSSSSLLSLSEQEDVSSALGPSASDVDLLAEHYASDVTVAGLTLEEREAREARANTVPTHNQRNHEAAADRQKKMSHRRLVTPPSPSITQ